MTRIGKTAVVAAAGAALVLGSTTWAGAGQGEDEGVPATLGVLDYEPGLLTGADIDAIPGFAVDASYGGQIEPYFGGEDLNISIVAAPQVTTLDTADLNAVTKAAAKHLATVAKEYRKKT